MIDLFLSAVWVKTVGIAHLMDQDQPTQKLLYDLKSISSDYLIKLKGRYEKSKIQVFLFSAIKRGLVDENGVDIEGGFKQDVADSGEDPNDATSRI